MRDARDLEAIDPEDVPGPPLGASSWDDDPPSDGRRDSDEEDSTWEDRGFDPALIGHPL